MRICEKVRWNSLAPVKVKIAHHIHLSQLYIVHFSKLNISNLECYIFQKAKTQKWPVHDYYQKLQGKRINRNLSAETITNFVFRKRNILDEIVTLRQSTIAKCELPCEIPIGIFLYDLEVFLILINILWCESDIISVMHCVDKVPIYAQGHLCTTCLQLLLRQPWKSPSLNDANVKDLFTVPWLHQDLVTLIQTNH